MKRLFAILAFAVLIAVSAPPCEAVSVNLSPDVISQCLAEGKAAGSVSELLGKYILSLSNGPVSESVEVVSAKARLRLEAWLAARESKEIDPDVLESIVSHPVLTVNVRTFGYSAHFAIDVNVVLIQGEKVIQPCWLTNPEIPEAASSQEGDASYVKLISAEFRYSDFDPAAKTRVVVSREGEETSFDVDLSRID